MIKFLFFLSFISYHLTLPAQDLPSQNLVETSYKEDLLTTFKLLGEGSIEQFKSQKNLYALGFFIPATWYGFEHDKRLNSSLSNKDYGGWVRVVSDSSVLMSFPVLPLTTYFIGKNSADEKLVRFSMEFVSAFYLAMIESGLISFIDVHERPRTDQTTFWEEAFRGNSSFPSGHVIPYSMLTFKVLQFYGPYTAILPAAAAIVVAFERVNSQKHWSSDVIAGIGLSYFASEGVRLAADKRLKDKKQLSGGIIRYQNTLGPKLIYAF